MAAKKLVHRGFTYSREELRWGKGDFAIFPTGGEYELGQWVAEWAGAAIAQGESLHEAIVRLEDEGYIPIVDEEDEIPGEKDTGEGRYMDAIPGKCSRCAERGAVGDCRIHHPSHSGKERRKGDKGVAGYKQMHPLWGGHPRDLTKRNCAANSRIR